MNGFDRLSTGCMEAIPKKIQEKCLQHTSGSGEVGLA